MKTNPLKGVLFGQRRAFALSRVTATTCATTQASSAKPLTWRFSCGYGDFPLSQQKDFVNALELPKRIGVFYERGEFYAYSSKIRYRGNRRERERK